jgi:hypothetical protein
LILDHEVLLDASTTGNPAMGSDYPDHRDHTCRNGTVISRRLRLLVLSAELDIAIGHERRC